MECENLVFALQETLYELMKRTSAGGYIKDENC